MDLIDEPQGNAHDYTVSEISGAVKRVIEGEFGRVRVRGEVGRVVMARTGHLYFDLKDDRNVIAAVSWKGQVGRLATMPEEGMEIIATGRLTTYGPQSKYQLNVEDVQPAGAGALMAMLEKRRAKLAAEGLFDAARKKKLPFLPEVIGVVTSPSGAVIRDILHRLRERFPRRVIVWPVAVQGAACAPEVARAINGFNALESGGAVPRPDLIIVARGGGSVEDLWGFNEEIVVRAAAASRIPLISAVGHETDVTLIDHAADLRAPTPTAAAELAVPVRADLLRAVEQIGLRMGGAMDGALRQRRQRLGDVGRALPRGEALLAEPRQRLDMLEQRLPAALRKAVHDRALRLERVALSPAMLGKSLAVKAGALERAGGRLPAVLARVVAARQVALARVGLSPGALERKLDDGRRRVAALEPRLAPAFARGVARAGERLTAAERLLVSVSYEATLKRGFAVVRGDGKVVTESAVARAASVLEIEFVDGKLTVGAPGPAAKPAPKPGPTGQGSLF